MVLVELILYIVTQRFRMQITFTSSWNIYPAAKFTTLLGTSPLSHSRRKELKSHFEAILFYMAEIATALEYLHRHDIAYRDLKPENVLIDAEGHAKIVDLGFAKKLENNRTSTMCGTPGYLSPEQMLKKGEIASIICRVRERG